MKKILHQFSQLFQTENFDQINGIMLLLFKEKSTLETITIFEKVKIEMTAKMMNQLSLSKEEVRLIEGYFKNKSIVNKREYDPSYDERLTESI